jgi:O-antigen/teichoic acid export membrane protein
VPWWLLTGAGVLTQLLMLASGVMTARLLGVDGRGQALLVATLGAVAAQLTLGGGLADAVTKLLAENGLTARDGLRGIVGTWVPGALAAGTIAAAVFLVFERDHLGLTAGVLAVCVLVTALQGMGARLMVGAMLGEGTDPIRIALTTVLPQAAVVGALAISLLFGVPWNVVGVMGITILCSAMVLAAQWWSLAPSDGPDAQSLDPAELRGLARRTHIGSVGPIDGLALDRLMVGALLGNGSLGLYSVAYSVSSLHNILGITLARVALPRLSVLQNDPVAERKQVARTMLLTTVLMVAITLPLLVIIGPLIRIAFGEAFAPATTTARWVVVASAFLGFRRVQISVLQARDRSRYASIVEFVLAGALVLGILVAWRADSLQLVGIVLTGVGVLACLALGAEMGLARHRVRGRHDSRIPFDA